MNYRSKLYCLLLLVCVGCKSTDLVTPIGVSTFVSVADFKQQLKYEVYPRSIAFDADGNLYAADFYRIFKITPNRQISLFAGTTDKEGYRNGPGRQALFQGISALAIDSKGNLFVGEQLNHCIRRITPDGVVSLFGHSSFCFFL